jgi:hypothetical protein
VDPLEEIDPRWRTLVVASVALAYPVGTTGFQLGAYGELFFDNMFTAWITVTAIMIVLLIIPAKKKQHLRTHIWVLAIPSVWILVRFVLGYTDPDAMLHPILFAIGTISFALCVPYAFYLIVRIANPGLADLREPRLRWILAGIALFFLAAGYGIGLSHELFQSCEELELLNQALPSHCQRTG